jgi:CBS domain-containing protein
MLSRSHIAPDSRIGALMTPRPITIDVSDPIAEAASLMSSCRVRHLPVLAGTRLAGVISVRDVIGADTDLRVGDAISGQVDTAGPGWTIAAACERMLDKRHSCLPVLDGDQLLGIFTATDALRFAIGVLENERREPSPIARVARFMTGRPLTTVQPTTPLRDAWQLMRTANVRHLPVLDGETIVGILCDRDVLAVGKRWLRSPAGESGILVADAMSPRVVTVQAERPALDAARLLLRRRLGALPVLRGTELGGILTVHDFIYWILSVS